MTIWAVAGDLDPETIDPGTFEMEWPRGSGQIQRFPELDRVGWFSLDCGQDDPAHDKLVVGQRPFLERLRQAL